jgi:hypothetical protein
MNRVAVCISGQPRNVEAGFEFINKHVIQPNQADVFIHTWQPTATEAFINPINGSEVGDAVGADITNTILDLYKPHGVIFDTQFPFDEKDYNDRAYPGMKASWMLSMWYSVMTANWLKCNAEEEFGPKYDAVFRMRFDWALTRDLTVTDIDPNVKGRILVPRDCAHPTGINDQFAVGSSKNMDVYSSVYDHIEEYYRQDNQPFCNEILLKHHLTKQNIEFRPIGMEYGLIRSADRIQWGKR